MTIKEAISLRWTIIPTSLKDAQYALTKPDCSACLVCGSKLILPIIRPPMPDYRAHCNHCGSEVPIAVMLNRKAWQIIAKFDNETLDKGRR